jgi:hypothetical protein
MYSRTDEVQEEGVLKDVLEELDKERSKRAELEAKIRELEAQQRDRASSKDTKIRALHYEMEGYKDIVNALTASNPAVSKASTHCTIPIHVIRLLEIMPWDERAREFIIQMDVLYEWQIYTEKQWQGNVKYLPPILRNLPIVKPLSEDHRNKNANTESSSLLQTQTDPSTTLVSFLAGQQSAASTPAPMKSRTLTDTSLTKVYNMDHQGYPLPTSPSAGTWEWIAGWFLHPQSVTNKESSATLHQLQDEEGWVFGSSVETLVQEMTTNDPSSGRSSSLPSSQQLRCRRWNRQRILTAYPFMCERTKAYLSLYAENARLGVACRKISEQLGATKTKLTDTEETLTRYMSRLEKAVKLLDKVAPHSMMDEAHKSEIMQFLAENKAIDSIVRNHATRKALYVTDISTVLGPVDDDVNINDSMQTNEGSLDVSSNSSAGDMLGNFDWKRLARGGLRDRIQLSQKHYQTPPKR